MKSEQITAIFMCIVWLIMSIMMLIEGRNMESMTFLVLANIWIACNLILGKIDKNAK